MNIRPIAGIAMVSLLAACGSATDATTFAAPPGYTQVASLGPWVDVWRGTDPKSALVFVAIPTKMTLKEAIDQSDVHDTDVKARKTITICGAQSAYYMDVIGTVNTKVDSTKYNQPPNSRIEIVATELNGKTYVAIYKRAIDAAADPAADAAIKNVCPKGSS